MLKLPFAHSNVNCVDFLVLLLLSLVFSYSKLVDLSARVVIMLCWSPFIPSASPHHIHMVLTSLLDIPGRGRSGCSRTGRLPGSAGGRRRSTSSASKIGRHLTWFNNIILTFAFVQGCCAWEPKQGSDRRVKIFEGALYRLVFFFVF